MQKEEDRDSFRKKFSKICDSIETDVKQLDTFDFVSTKTLIRNSSISNLEIVTDSLLQKLESALEELEGFKDKSYLKNNVEVLEDELQKIICIFIDKLVLKLREIHFNNFQLMDEEELDKQLKEMTKDKYTQLSQIIENCISFEEKVNEASIRLNSVTSIINEMQEKITVFFGDRLNKEKWLDLDLILKEKEEKLIDLMKPENLPPIEVINKYDQKIEESFKVIKQSKQETELKEDFIQIASKFSSEFEISGELGHDQTIALMELEALSELGFYVSDVKISVDELSVDVGKYKDVNFEVQEKLDFVIHKPHFSFIKHKPHLSNVIYGVSADRLKALCFKFGIKHAYPSEEGEIRMDIKQRLKLDQKDVLEPRGYLVLLFEDRKKNREGILLITDRLNTMMFSSPRQSGKVEGTWIGHANAISFYIFGYLKGMKRHSLNPIHHILESLRKDKYKKAILFDGRSGNILGSVFKLQDDRF
ncbi:MAG: hypothetical protein ACTSQF_15820 [Candidatus Heimdallarchaeaceae archaeon]